MMIKVFFKSTALIVISACIGLLALMAVYALPTEPMSRHVKDSIEIYQKEGLYYSWAPGKNSSQIDNFTDSIMLRETIYPADGSVLENALLNPNFGYKDDDQVQSLIKQLQGEKEDFVFYYSRYWHGYLFFLKPALLITNISNIRMANALLQMFLAASIIYLLGLKLGRGYAFSYFLTYLFLNPISLALSFQYSTMYYLMSFISLFILLRTDWVSKGQHFLYVFLFSGILTAFFDFLTYPLISIGIPLTIFLLLTRYYQNTREIFQTIILSTVFWGFGYGGMYISKWVLGNLLTNKDVISDSIQQLGHRVSSSGSDDAMANVVVSPWKAIFQNLKIFFREVILFPVMGSLIYALYRIRKVRKNNLSIDCFSALRRGLMFIACYPFFWYIVFRNHSYIHYWFTYREIGISIFAIGCLLSTFFSTKLSRKEEDYYE